MTVRLNHSALASLCADLHDRAPTDAYDIPIGDPLRDEYEALSGPDKDRIYFYFRGVAAERAARSAEADAMRDMAGAELLASVRDELPTEPPTCEELAELMGRSPRPRPGRPGAWALVGGFLLGVAFWVSLYVVFVRAFE